MSEDVKLFSDNKPESYVAVQLLKDSAIPFKPIYGSGDNLPIAQYNGVSYHRIDGISVLVDSYSKK